MTPPRLNAWLRPSGLGEPVRVGDPWSSGLSDRSLADYLLNCMTPTRMSTEKGRRGDVNLTLRWTLMQSLPESDTSASKRWSLRSSREFETSVSLRKGVERLFDIGERSKSSIHTRLNVSMFAAKLSLAPTHHRQIGQRRQIPFRSKEINTCNVL